MQCPRCQSTLRQSFYEGVEIHTCPGCGGEFVPGAMLPQILRTRETTFDAEVLHDIEHHTPLYGVPADEIATDVACPGCQGPMRPVNYAGDTAVIVDRCDDCDGVWLDAKELAKIQAILEKWGAEAEGQLAMISHRLESARQDAAHAVGDAYQGSRFSFINAVINRILDAA